MRAEPMRRIRRGLFFRMSVLLGIGSLLAGCIDREILEYEPVALDLDGKSELHISTCPAGFPRRISGIPFLYKTTRTPESVFFQVFVRDIQKKSARTPTSSPSGSIRFPTGSTTMRLSY
ncbi:MAG: hypothetical protein HOP03_10385 [Lysobacter sp.]|nr:hypothetical protein [Lysobacter sp.]